MKDMELFCFQIISNVGGARSLYIEAIQEAKSGNYESAIQKVKEGKELFVLAHQNHAKIIQKEANGEMVNLSLLLIHAEDQLMSAEAFGILAEEFIDVYKKIR